MKQIITPKNICSVQQNHPELIVEDMNKIFKLDEAQKSIIRKILLLRGVNKWLWARRKFIDLKHRTKELMKNAPSLTHKELCKQIQLTYTEMQNIAKMPRWVEWGTKIHQTQRNNDREVVVKNG